MLVRESIRELKAKKEREYSFQYPPNVDFMNSLPQECFMYILSWCNVRDLSWIAASSREIYLVARSDLLWQHWWEHLCSARDVERSMTESGSNWRSSINHCSYFELCSLMHESCSDATKRSFASSYHTNQSKFGVAKGFPRTISSLGMTIEFANCSGIQKTYFFDSSVSIQWLHSPSPILRPSPPPQAASPSPTKRPGGQLLEKQASLSSYKSPPEIKVIGLVPVAKESFNSAVQRESSLHAELNSKVQETLFNIPNHVLDCARWSLKQAKCIATSIDGKLCLYSIGIDIKQQVKISEGISAGSLLVCVKVDGSISKKTTPSESNINGSIMFYIVNIPHAHTFQCFAPKKKVTILKAPMKLLTALPPPPPPLGSDTLKRESATQTVGTRPMVTFTIDICIRSLKTVLWRHTFRRRAFKLKSSGCHLFDELSFNQSKKDLDGCDDKGSGGGGGGGGGDSSGGGEDYRCVLVEEGNLALKETPIHRELSRHCLSEEERILSELPSLHIPISHGTLKNNKTENEKVARFDNIVILDLVVWNDKSNSVHWSFSMPVMLKLKSTSATNTSKGNIDFGHTFIVYQDSEKYGWIIMELEDLRSKQARVKSAVISLLI